jgi:hypothetical protein
VRHHVAALDTLIPTVIGLGLAIAICSPVSVVTVIVLLSMPAGRKRAIAFLVGWVLAIVVIGAVTVLVLNGQDFSSRTTTPSRAASAIEILLGCIVVFASARAFRRRGRRARSAETPKWLDRLDRTPWLLALPVGAFMLTYSLTLAAAVEILKADVSAAEAALAFAVFALASIVSIAAPLVLVLVAPERSAERLAEWRAWLLGNAHTIGLVVLMVVGGLLVAHGIYDLVA